MFLALALAAVAWQEPAPTPPAQEPAKVTPAEILAAIEKLRASYDGADQSVRTAVETPAPSPVERAPALAAAESALDGLVQDMEDLLKLLPKPDQSSSSSSSSSSSQSPSQSPDGAGDQAPRNQPHEGQGHERPTGRGPVPPPGGPPLTGQPLPAYARWGLLPPRLQEALRSSSATDVPLRYRRWLEEYQRRGAQPR